MPDVALEIRPFRQTDQAAVDVMMTGIEEEFSQPIAPARRQKLEELSQLSNRFYWVAVHAGRVAGTIGVVLLHKSAALKAMFIAKEFRGPEAGIANRLLQRVIDHCLANQCTTLYLGTMDQFKGAQRFYEKKGFVRIEQSELPGDFPASSVDTVFYRKDLS